MFSCWRAKQKKQGASLRAMLNIGEYEAINLDKYIFMRNSCVDMSKICELRVQEDGNQIGSVKFTTSKQEMCQQITYLGDTPVYCMYQGSVVGVRFESFSTTDISKGLLVCVYLKDREDATYHVIFK